MALKFDENKWTQQAFFIVPKNGREIQRELRDFQYSYDPLFALCRGEQLFQPGRKRFKSWFLSWEEN